MNTIQQIETWISDNRPRRIAVLTGAGISAESGIPTFRGSGGLWKNFRAEDLATPEAFERDPRLVWEWYEWRRSLIREAQPNAAHRALVSLESQTPATIITQNVDGLHRRAGSTNIVELHGNIFRARCSRERTVFEFSEVLTDLPPRCDCGALLRPDIVWFGEALDPLHLAAAVTAIESCDLLLIIGTSALVYPAAGLASYLRHGKSIEINPEATPLSSSCDFVLAEKAGAAVPLIVEAILGAPR